MFGRISRPLAPLMLLILVVAAAHADPPAINATLEPRQIVLGESAQLTITTTGSTPPSLQMPAVSGLEFGIMGQSRRIQLMNGAMISSTSTIIRVTPQVAGVFTIPLSKSQPLVLQVSPADGSNQSANSYGAPAHKPILPGGSTANGLKLTPDGSAFVRLILPKRDFYVGESIPVEIEVGMRDGFVSSLNGLPTLSGGDFTLTNLSHQPERVQKVIDGNPFMVLTWHSVIAAVKPGAYSLNVGAPLTVRIRLRPQKDSVIDDLLGDPFMQNYFGQTISKEINVTSPTSDMTVLALPAEGRPAEFSGAVGQFKIAGDISSSASAVGDPLTLRLHVKGEGNFDRVDSPMLDHLEQWKTYPPRSNFKQSEPTGYKGEKIFEQPLIASAAGARALPGMSFSWFDPTTRRYETAKTDPLTVTVSPVGVDAGHGAAPGAGGAVSAKAASGNGGPGAAPAGLHPDHAADGAGTGSDSLRPAYLDARLLVIPAALAGAFAGAWLLLRRRRGAQGRERLRAEAPLSKSASAVLKQLDAAAGAGDAALFFNSARLALRRLEAQPDAAAQPDATDDEVRQIFVLADEARYSVFDPASIDFRHWIDVVRRELAKKTAA